ncbi:N-acetylglucosaminyl transferase component-domain-containing protein [Mycena rebaudengoi]|nr:N-acetylglucosaminyl transferase component-domain-containing protein [Mycena rebaudengoi]
MVGGVVEILVGNEQLSLELVIRLLSYINGQTQIVFWPEDVPISGVCYGWRTPVLYVAGVVEGANASELGETLTALCSSAEWSRAARTCNGSPVVLGPCSFRAGRAQLDGFEYTIILYHRHSASSLRFYTLEGALSDTETPPANHILRTAAFATSLEHDFTNRIHGQPGGISGVVINQFNAAKTFEGMLQNESPSNLNPLPAEFSTYILDALDAALYVLRNAHVKCDEGCVPRSLASLKEISSTIQQLDARAAQLAFLTREAIALRRPDTGAVSPFSTRYTNFFNTVWLILNDLVLGIGVGSFLCENHAAFAGMLGRFGEVHARCFLLRRAFARLLCFRLVFDSPSLITILVSWVCGALRWLDAWPAGLKLNTELSRFYAHAIGDLVGVWGHLLTHLAPALPALIYGFGLLSACGGLTTVLALLSDLLALASLHLQACYAVSWVLYERGLYMAGGLERLFRGRRYNVLCRRTDSWEYDTDQLLFGTILFTLLAFLFPTVLAYYALFALMRVATILLNACLEMQLAFMNHFPLFALMLRAKDPWRLPDGIYFSVEYPTACAAPHLVVKSRPVPFSSIFFQYIHLGSRLAAYYNPLRLLWCVLRGEYLTKIPRYEMRYNGLLS